MKSRASGGRKSPATAPLDAAREERRGLWWTSPEFCTPSWSIVFQKPTPLDDPASVVNLNTVMRCIKPAPQKRGGFLFLKKAFANKWTRNNYKTCVESSKVRSRIRS